MVAETPLVFFSSSELENSSPGALLKAILLKFQRQLGRLPQKNIRHSDSSGTDYGKVWGGGDGVEPEV